MKHKCILALAVIFFQISFLHAQKFKSNDSNEVLDDRLAFEENDLFVTLGYGYGSFYFVVNSQDQLRITGPIYAKVEKAISNRLGIGINMAYSQNRSSSEYYFYNGNETIAYTEIIDVNLLSILARLTWHYGDFKDFDPYMGFGMGYRLAQERYVQKAPFNNSSNNNIRNNIPFGFDFTIGARYFFTPQIGIYTEFGVAQSVGQIGFCAKF